MKTNLRERFKHVLRERLKNIRTQVAVGVSLLAVPTVFTVLSELQDWNGWLRFGIVILWVVVAVVAIRLTAERDVVIGHLAEEKKHLRQNLRLTATTQMLAALLRPGTKGIPDHYEFTVYVYDEEKLTPFWPYMDFREDPDPRIFRPGKGATGTAWLNHKTVVVTGTEVANDRYGLTPEQQKFFEDYRTAVATPIWEEGSAPFGVLTCLGLEDDGFFSDETGPGQDSLRSLADVVGVLLTTIPEPTDLL